MGKSLPGFGSSCYHLCLFCIFKCLEKWVGTFKCKCEKVNKYQTPNLALLPFWLTDEGKCTAWPITRRLLPFYQITFKKASHFGHVFSHSFQCKFFLNFMKVSLRQSKRIEMLLHRCDLCLLTLCAHFHYIGVSCHKTHTPGVNPGTNHWTKLTPPNLHMIKRKLHSSPLSSRPVLQKVKHHCCPVRGQWDHQPHPPQSHGGHRDSALMGH